MVKTAEAEKLIYVRTAAQMLCCTERHIYNMVQDGRLEAVKMGPRGIRIKRYSVDQYIRENTIDPDEFYA